MAHVGWFIGFAESKVHILKIRQIDHWSLIENYRARNTSNATKYKFQWGACLEWFPFFRHNIHIFFLFFIDCSFKEEVLAIQSTPPTKSIPERKPRRND